MDSCTTKHRLEQCLLFGLEYGTRKQKYLHLRRGAAGGLGEGGF